MKFVGQRFRVSAEPFVCAPWARRHGCKSRVRLGNKYARWYTLGGVRVSIDTKKYLCNNNYILGSEGGIADVSMCFTFKVRTAIRRQLVERQVLFCVLKCRTCEG